MKVVKTPETVLGPARYSISLEKIMQRIKRSPLALGKCRSEIRGIVPQALKVCGEWDGVQCASLPGPPCLCPCIHTIKSSLRLINYNFIDINLNSPFGPGLGRCIAVDKNVYRV